MKMNMISFDNAIKYSFIYLLIYLIILSYLKIQRLSLCNNNVMTNKKYIRRKRNNNNKYYKTVYNSMGERSAISDPSQNKSDVVMATKILTF